MSIDKRTAAVCLTVTIFWLLLFVLTLSTSFAATWVGWRQLSVNQSGSVNPAIAFDSSGSILHVVWADYTPGNYDVYYKKSTDGGASWGGFRKISYNSGQSRYPAIAYDSYRNNVHVVWSDDTGGGNANIYYKKSTNGGSSWGGFKQITYNSSPSDYPDIAVDSSGNIHVVWQDYSPGNYDIYYKKSTNGGASWGGFRKITVNNGSSVCPAIATDSSNRIHVVWSDNKSGNAEIHYKRSTNGGASWGDWEKICTNGGASVYPDIAVDSNDHIHVVWADYTPGNANIFYKKSTDGGLNWTGFKKISDNSGESVDPAIAIDSSDTIHVVWSDDTPGNYEIHYKCSTDGGASWTGFKKIHPNSGRSDCPVMAIDSLDKIHVVWSDNTPAFFNYEIMYKQGQ
jgi:hypothetical protein